MNIIFVIRHLNCLRIMLMNYLAKFLSVHVQKINENIVHLIMLM